MFYLGGVALAIFLALLLVTKRNRSRPDSILSVWLFFIASHLLFFYFFESGLYPNLLGISLPYPLLHGPFLYLYTMALTNRLPTIWLTSLHFIPFLAGFIYTIPFLILPAEQKVYIFQHQGQGYEIFNNVLKIAIISSGLLYVIGSGLALRNHRRNIADQFSDTEKISLKWLQYLVYWIGLIWTMVIFTNDTWIFGSVVLFIFFIGFFGIRQVGIFYTPAASLQYKPSSIRDTLKSESRQGSLEKGEDKPDTGEIERRKYQKSGLGQAEARILHSKLLQLVTDQKIYTKQELSLSELADQLNTQSNHLSQVINEQEGKNFYDYINSLRIEEFKRMVASADSKKYTLLALAEHCGFSSKSSFNRYFKKVTGLSPSEFMHAVPVSEN